MNDLTDQPTALQPNGHVREQFAGGTMNEVRSNRVVITGGVLAMVLTAVFFSLFFNRFAGLRSGAGEYVGGVSLLHGNVPFRDYFTTSPPLNQFKSAIFLRLFGENLIVSRTAGMIERSLIALLLYLWLLRLYRPAYAAVAAFATLVISTADFTDTIASYNHDSLFYAMFSGYFASFVLDRSRSVRFLVGMGFASGFAAGLGLLTKQTIGLGAVVAVPVVVAAIVWRLQTLRRAITWLASFAGGAAIPVGSLLIWLASVGALKTFLVAIFIKGPAAKAQNGGGDFVTRAISTGLLGPRPMILATCAALIAVWLVLRSLSTRAKRDHDTRPWEMLAMAVFAIVSIALGAAFSFRHWGQVHRSWPSNTIMLTAVAIVSLLVFGTWQLLKGTLTERQAQIYLFAAVSFNIAFMLSLSFPLFSPMLLPGFGLLFAGSLAGSNRIGRLAVCAIVLLVCVDTV